MALFGKKDDDKSNENIEDIDAKILAAIEETDAEEEQRKADRKQAEIERMAKQSQEREAKAAVQAKGSVSRRFFIMPKETEIGDNMITVRGTLFGQAHVGDSVFIYRPNGQIVKSTVLSIVSAGIDQSVPEGEKATGAKNAVVLMSLQFNFNNIGFDADKVIPEFSVISNAQPTSVADKHVENPSILGLTLEYKNFAEDKKFVTTLVNHMVRAKFVMPVHSTDKIGANGKPAMQILTLNGKDENDNRMLPIFTDASALKMWKDIFNDENKPRVVVSSFQEIVKIVEKDNFDFIINPFGPVAVRIPNDFIVKMINSTSYKNVFGEDGQGKKKYRKENITDGSKIAVGAPPQIAEVKAVRDVIKSYCATVPSINTAGLLCKIVKGGEPSYLCIVDCPKAEARDIFMGIHEAVSPLLNKIKRIEFSRYEETVFADQYFANEPFDYVKNPNA